MKNTYLENLEELGTFNLEKRTVKGKMMLQIRLSTFWEKYHLRAELGPGHLIKKTGSKKKVLVQN